MPPTRLRQRHGSAAQWSVANPLLSAGELGVETDTRKLKCGDGVTLWNALPYAASGAEVTVDADGVLTVDGTTVELVTTAALNAALAGNAPVAIDGGAP